MEVSWADLILILCIVGVSVRLDMVSKRVSNLEKENKELLKIVASIENEMEV